MSKNREQIKTGLRAILSGGIKPEHSASNSSSENRIDNSSDIEDVVPEPVAASTVAVVEIAPPVEMVDPQPVAAPAEVPTRKPKKRAAPPPPVQKPQTTSAVRVGTLENPYVRKRDNLPTRKVGIVLPVALAERMQIHCVKSRTRPNEFVARAIEALLDELGAEE